MTDDTKDVAGPEVKKGSDRLRRFFKLLGFTDPD